MYLGARSGSENKKGVWTMNIKRYLSFFLSLAMLLSCVGFAAAEEVPEIKLTGVVNQYGWAVPQETLSFTYYSCDDDATSQAEEDARLEGVDKVLKEEFNIEIQKLVYAQDSEERLNLMLASNDYPDLIVGLSDTMANVFIEQGRAVELTPYLEKYGQNVLASYGDYINLLREDDGSLYKLSSCIGNTTDVMGRDFALRWDWLQETGLPAPTSFESFYEAVKAMVALHPTNENGEKVYGITAFTMKGAEFYQTPLMYLGLYNSPTGLYKVNDDGSLTYWVDTEEGRQVAHYINKFWQEGLIDPDFQTKDYDTSVAFMSSERVAGNIGTWWHNLVGGHQIWETTEADYTVDKRMQDYTWQEGESTPKLISNNYIRTNRVIITDKCQNPAAVMRYLDWQTSPLGIAFNSMGPQGEDMAWFINADGDIQISDKYWFGDPGNMSFTWADFETETCGGWNYPIANPGYTPVNAVDDPAKGWASPVVQVNMWDLIPDYAAMDYDTLSNGNKMMLFNDETSDPYLADLTSWTISFAADSEEALILLDVNERLLTDWCNCIMADTAEECDKLYDEMVANLHDLGLDQLVAAQQETFQKNQSKLDGSYWAE